MGTRTAARQPRAGEGDRGGRPGRGGSRGGHPAPAAYDPATGRQRDDWETHARIIEGIRARSDALVYPTIPLAGSGYADKPGADKPGEPKPDARFAHTQELARRGLIKLAVVDPGSMDFLRFDEADRPGTGFVYRNAPEEVRAALAQGTPDVRGAPS